MHRNDVTHDGAGSSSPSSLDGSHGGTLAADYHSQPLPQQRGGTHSSGSSAASTGNQNSKTGRKGDPRMHRAVAARLEDPKMSLFDALKIGGFEYSDDHDSNAMDSEHITLGQRKNQLSRRVRLARQPKKEHKEPGQYQLPDESLSGAAAQAATSEKIAGAPSSSSLHSGTTPVTGNKRPFLMTEGDGGLSEDPAAKILSSCDVPSDRVALDESRSIMAKHHPGYHPILLQQRLAPLSTGTGSNSMVHGYLVNQNLTQGGATFPVHQHQQQAAIDSGLGAPSVNAFGSVPTPGTDASATFPSLFPSISTTSTLGGVSSSLPQYQGAGFAAGTAQQPSTDTTNVVTNTSSRVESLTSSRASPPQDPQVPAGVTIASLTKSAASVGMTLEQLAMALRNTNNLARILLSGGGSTPSQAQQDLAVSLYQSESRSLYERSMLRAGYPSEIAQNERSPQYLQMALEAWQSEGQRLNALANQQQELMDPPLTANAPSGSGPSGSSGAVGDGGTGGAARPRDHSHNHQQDSTRNAGDGFAGGGCAFEGGRHIHRLEGRCGHRAILHQPADGSAHIDFVVGNKIECYHGVEPLSSNPSSQDESSNIKIWPSKYQCKDLSCENKCRDGEIESKTKGHTHRHSECMVVGDPKILDLGDIDLDGKEWNSDFSNGDTVLGLFKLGDSTRASSAVNSTTGVSSQASFDGNASAQPMETSTVKE